MSFTITVRQGPARLASRLPDISKVALRSTSSAKPSSPFAGAVRAFSQRASSRTANSFTPRSTTTTTAILKSSAPKNAFARFSARTYMQQSAPAVDQGSTMRRLLVGGAIFGGTLVAINAVFNRETREDGGMPAYEREYLNSTFLHTGLGVGIIGLTARQMIQTGFVYRLMVTSPWAVAIGGLALSFGTMIGTRMIDPDK